MLEALLASFAAARRPDGVELVFLVVDNDVQRSAEPGVARFGERIGGGRVHYAVEPNRGIPMARNRAIEEAKAMGADLLAFVDDDETVDPDWIVETVAALCGRNLELVGGPIRCTEWTNGPSSGFWQRLLFDGIRARYVAKEKSASRKFRDGHEDQIVIVTNNWLIDMSWLERTGLRFDERLRFTGGSDALFYKQAKALGIRSGWCDSALVRERIPSSRSTFSYQFMRARNQSISSFHRNHGRATAGVALGAVSSCVLKMAGCLACLVSLPFIGGPALIQLARQSGWAVGRLQALAGAKSSLYLEADGE